MRNFECRHYDICLNRAAKANTSFNCDACRRYRPTPYHATVADIAGSLALLAAIERPDEYSAVAGRPDFMVQLMRAMTAILHEST